MHQATRILPSRSLNDMATSRQICYIKTNGNLPFHQITIGFDTTDNHRRESRPTLYL